MKFELIIKSGNAAMVDDTETAVAEILRKVADKIEAGRVSDVVLDLNGNAVGSFRLDA